MHLVKLPLGPLLLAVELLLDGGLFELDFLNQFGDFSVHGLDAALAALAAFLDIAIGVAKFVFEIAQVRIDRARHGDG
jgi:hypothetical protein